MVRIYSGYGKYGQDIVRIWLIYYLGLVKYCLAFVKYGFGLVKYGLNLVKCGLGLVKSCPGILDFMAAHQCILNS